MHRMPITGVKKTRWQSSWECCSLWSTLQSQSQQVSVSVYWMRGVVDKKKCHYKHSSETDWLSKCLCQSITLCWLPAHAYQISQGSSQHMYRLQLLITKQLVYMTVTTREPFPLRNSRIWTRSTGMPARTSQRLQRQISKQIFLEWKRLWCVREVSGCSNLYAKI